MLSVCVCVCARVTVWAHAPLTHFAMNCILLTSPRAHEFTFAPQMFFGILETIDRQNTMMKQQARNIEDITEAVQGINDLMATAQEIALGNIDEADTPGIVWHCANPFWIGFWWVGTSVSLERALERERESEREELELEGWMEGKRLSRSRGGMTRGRKKIVDQEKNEVVEEEQWIRRVRERGMEAGWGKEGKGLGWGGAPKGNKGFTAVVKGKGNVFWPSGGQLRKTNLTRFMIIFCGVFSGVDFEISKSEAFKVRRQKEGEIACLRDRVL